MTEANPFLERLNRIKAEKAAKEAVAVASQPKAEPPAPDPFADDVPVLDEQDGFSEERLELDTFMAGIDICDAYIRWCGKKHEDFNTNKREGIKISCPIPSHPDADPSAWINKDKQVWFCGGCQEGGDKFDIASFRFGHNYKADPSAFVELKKAMAADYGWVSVRTLSGAVYLEKQEVWEEQDEATPSAPDVPTQISAAQSTESTSASTAAATDSQAKSETIKSDSTPATITVADQVFKQSEDDRKYPSLDWRLISSSDTFLDVWMTEFEKDDLPTEYYLFGGLVALGAAVGRSVALESGSPIYPNLLCCIVGETGIGKSRSTGALSRLLHNALPYDYTDPFSRGVKILPKPGSGEVLMKGFSCPILDPNDPKKVLGYSPVKGVVDFDEFSNLTSRSSRMGSTLQQTLMQLYDGYVPKMAVSSMTHGVIEVSDPFVLGLATTQPGTIRDLVANVDKSSGFLNRWIFVTGNRKDSIDIKDYKFDIKPSVEKLRSIFTWAAKGYTLEFDSAAREAYREYFYSRIDVMKGDLDPTGGLLARMDLVSKKLLVLLCVNEKTNIVTLEIMEKMKHLYEYIFATFMFTNGYIGTHDDLPIQEAIVNRITSWTKKYNKPIKKGELFRGPISRQWSSEKIVRVMKTMMELGFLEEVQIKPKSGPPTIGYKLPDPEQQTTQTPES